MIVTVVPFNNSCIRFTLWLSSFWVSSVD